MQVWRGDGLFARLICRIVGFPESCAQTQVCVDFTPQSEGEVWTRNFGSKRFSSTQRSGAGRNARLLVESFGPVQVALALVVDGDRLGLINRHLSLWRIPLPKALLPKGTTFESETGGRFRFDVEIAAPFVGLIVRYAGNLSRH